MTRAWPSGVHSSYIICSGSNCLVRVEQTQVERVRVPVQVRLPKLTCKEMIKLIGQSIENTILIRM
jgi:hypothetical protein